MIPIRDDNPISRRPYVTVALIAINLLVFIGELTRGGDGMERMVWKYGYVPAELVRSSEEVRSEMAEKAPRVPVRDPFGRPVMNSSGQVLVQRVPLPVDAALALPAWLNIFTCMFLHGGWMHLLGNMLYLWIFGNNVEDRLGPILYLLFYLGTGVMGNLLHTFFEPAAVPLVGASGAISGVMGGYIMLFPHARVTAIIPIGWYPATINLPAWVFLGVYIVIQNLYPASFGLGQGGVAYLAHIGGFGAGALTIRLFPRRPMPARPVRRVPDDDDADFVL